MINDIFVWVEAYSITNGFSLLDDNYLRTANPSSENGTNKGTRHLFMQRDSVTSNTESLHKVLLLYNRYSLIFLCF